MRLQLSGKLTGFLLILFVCFNNAQAADWSGEIYGGRYYDDKRLGSYLVLSHVQPEGPILIGEFFYERYTDYEFAGVGGHFLWPVAQSVNIGFVVSQAWETQEFSGFDDFDYQTRIAGLSLEFNSKRVTLAAQSGKYYTDYDDTDYEDTAPMYLSADLYVWSPSYNWYLRGATRWISDDSLYYIEGYHTTYVMGVPFTGYIGASVFNSNIVSDVNLDSVYAGAYIELFSAPYSTLFLWTEVSEFDGETLLTVELSLLFGPGARTPYITAFGFPLDR